MSFWSASAVSERTNYLQSIKVRRNASSFQLHNVGAQFNSASEWLAKRDFSHLFLLRVASHAGLCHAFLPDERLCNEEGTRDKFKFKFQFKYLIILSPYRAFQE